MFKWPLDQVCATLSEPRSTRRRSIRCFAILPSVRAGERRACHRPGGAAGGAIAVQVVGAGGVGAAPSPAPQGLEGPWEGRKPFGGKGDPPRQMPGTTFGS